MVIKEDGTKWACQSCLKGHRVSGCTHTDRELTLVPKKGRPVTQCHHCRLERKKRSAHVKCDCGEVEKPHHPKEKCIHLREAEERAKAGFHDDHHEEKDPAHLAAVAEEQGCCCHHGGKCTCSFLKREPGIDDGSTPPHGPAVPKPRLDSTRSDGSITVFANGHHKPVHRKNFAAHECGMPYKMPAARHNSDQSVASAATRSVDSLALNNNLGYANYQANVPYQSEPIRSHSGENSPMRPHRATLSSMDFSDLRNIQPSNSIDTTVNDSTAFPQFGPTSSIAESSYDPWSAFPSDSSIHANGNTFGAWPSVFENGSIAQPALTAASSGTQSEVDEIPNMDDFYGASMQMPIIQEDANVQPGFVDDSNINRRSLPPGFFGNVDFSMPSGLNMIEAPAGNAMESGSGKSNSGDTVMGFIDPWQSPRSPSAATMAPRSAMSPSGRPQSQSVGPSSAPAEDLIRQLFPDIDAGSPLFSMGNSPSAGDLAPFKRGGGLSYTSAPIDSSAMDSMSAYAPQSWNDGSLSVPNDEFPSFNMDSNFASTEFGNGWQYQ
ncbi:unnamed protein product [Zymoseptoria tritici ST99CH_3D7]|uniref:Copper-fist domain-containing protein n=1 Tax=Zymoseptoria tritici (strain ST99CH_3D7) TaxID=1276538 RepID=A0A1X7RRN2_ZYMT9|nr:unnamed protein product [Zymoseptoria tritici ST99CH_3D7]